MVPRAAFKIEQEYIRIFCIGREIRSLTINEFEIAVFSIISWAWNFETPSNALKGRRVTFLLDQ